MPLPGKKLLWILPLVLGGILAVHLLSKHPPSTVELSESGGGKTTLPGHMAERMVLSDAFAGLSAKPETSKVTLEDLEKRLTSIPPDQAVAEIREFLHSGRDKDTGLPFEIGRDGKLTTSPTFRVFLLDLILKIDPASAAELSREVLASPTSADEWALALRNIAKFESSNGSSEFLRKKTVELINNPEWQNNPSVGYLNAFDILVHTEASTETPLLSNLIQRKDRKDLAHAAFLTLDRLVQHDPADMLERIAVDPSLGRSRPEMTAQQFARADLRDPAQREIVRKWLLNPSRTPVELRSFASTYPNANHFVSNNLLTQEKTLTGAELADHDREALAIVSSWEQDPEFQPVRESLRAILARLEGFVNGSKQPPLPEP